MFFIIGFITVIGCVIGGYVLHHGKLAILWQPTELLIIGGAAVGSFIIGNPPHIMKGALGGMKKLFKPKPYNKDNYIELLTFMFSIFKLIKSKGLLAIEADIENPHESELFKRFPSVTSDHHVVDFICDYIRMMSMGVENQYQLDDLMTAEIDIHHHEAEVCAGAITTMADGMPALGIVAAVLGVIITMGSITEPPEVLGGLIGAALVGTFLGVLLSYGFISPMGSYMAKFGDAETKYYQVIKTGILAHVQGNAPIISIEFARKQIPSTERPSFKEVEEAANNAGSAVKSE